MEHRRHQQSSRTLQETSTTLPPAEVMAAAKRFFTRNTSLYANASYLSRFDGGGFAYTGKAGVRVNW